MWICSKIGFFSVVRKADGQVHVRARRRQDLVNLVQFCRLKIKVLDSHPGSDYGWRIICTSNQWGTIALALASSVTYDNFKRVIGQTPDQDDKLPVYSDFHHAMERYQRDGEVLAWPNDPPDGTIGREADQG